MSHADHFLSRLDRLSLPDVELALSLYRDNDLLKHILSAAKLPDGVDRVAIALDKGDESPHIIVTRGGKFVTCLGPGMSPQPWPIVPRKQLDDITNRLDAYRSEIAARKKRFGPGGEFAALARGIYHRGCDVSREEFAAIALWQPLLGAHFFKLVIDCGEMMLNAQQALSPILKRTAKPRPEWKGQLHQFWKMIYATGHFGLLATMGGETVHTGVNVPETNRPIDSLISAFTMHDGVMPVCLKGAHAAARVGKPLLAFYAEMYQTADHILHLRESISCLGAIACRHRDLTEEIREILLPGPSGPNMATKELGRVLAKSLMTFIEQEDKLTVTTAIYGASLLQKMTESLPAGHRYRVENVANVPTELALGVALNVLKDLNKVGNFSEMLILLPVAAQANVEDFYLPKDLIDLYRRPWEPQDTLNLLESYIDELRGPTLRSKEPTRNGPCPCGSGKKYKRCCATD